jgi:ferrous iron transport protein A
MLKLKVTFKIVDFNETLRQVRRMGFQVLKFKKDVAVEHTPVETLAHLASGETAQIESIDSAFSERDRFLELGFTSGAQIVVLRKALFGDPIQIQVRGARYALRKADADKIKIKKV